jgi:glycosyltransferase involved in cell wall biosynthesis
VTSNASPRVSVIVPARNAEAQVRRLCEGLRRQTVSPDAFELLVVDDASTDHTAAAVSAEPRAQLIRLPRCVGPYPARNVAAARARGDLLAFTDADVLPAPDWLERGIRAFDSPEVDLIAGGIRIPLGERPSAVAMVDAARHLDQEGYVQRGYGVTANLWVRKAVFDEVGGFNERIMSGGDGEFGQRAQAAGKRLLYVPDARVDHPPREAPTELMRKGFRIGIGGTQQSLYAMGSLGASRPAWQYPRLYLPRRRLQGIHRLAASGHRPRALRHLQLLVVEYVFLTVPAILGSVVGSIRERRRRSTPGR